MAGSSQTALQASTREVKYAHAKEFPGILQELQVSLLVSTYQAGKLVVIGQQSGQLMLSFHNF